MSAFPGPACLGRGGVVAPGQGVPPALAACPRVRVDETVVGDPGAALACAAELRRRWTRRQPTVVELAVDPAVLEEREREARPAWQLGSEFAFSLEQLRHLVWANNYDLRGEDPVWLLTSEAERLGARPSAAADVHLAEHGDVYLDGGPRGPVRDNPLPLVHADSVKLGRLTVTRDNQPAAVGLADDQRAAVAHVAGPARVLAPAGSGKTRVLTERLRHLVTDRGVDADQVTAVAYNKRAAEQMRQRIGEVGSRVKTFHALAWEVLRDAHPRLELVANEQRRAFLHQTAPVQPVANTDVHRPYVEGFERVRLGLVPPAQVAATTPDAPDFVAVFQGWRQWMADHHVVDFGEQVFGALTVLLGDPDRRAAFQQSCRLLLVDEFQDLRPAFLLLVRLLAAPAWQVFGVGDDDQTIYGYANANPRHLVEFDRWFPQAATHELTTNYRCPADVVTAAARLLAFNDNREPKSLQPAADAPSHGLTTRLLPRSQHARQAVNWVEELLASDVARRDIVVLARVKAMLLPVHLGLVNAGIPARSEVGAAMLERAGARTALGWLRLAVADPERLDGADIAETIKRSAHKVRRDVREHLHSRATWTRNDLEKHVDGLDPWQAAQLRAWVADLDQVRDVAATSDTTAVLEASRGLLGEALATLDRSGPARAPVSHLDDVDALIQVAHLEPDPNAFERWLRRLLALDQPADRVDAVTLATIHSCKGLEWPRVLLYAANDGVMPHRMAPDREEERRVFHVALTRTSSEILILADRDAPSPFLLEMESTDITEATSSARRRAAAAARSAPSARPPRAALAAEERVPAAPRRPPTVSGHPVVPRVGATLQLANGITGTVEHVDGHGALVRAAEGAVHRARYGEHVEQAGTVGPLAPDGQP